MVMKIHALNYFNSDCHDPGGDAIIIECDGKFGMIDAGGAKSLQAEKNLADNKQQNMATPDNMLAANNIISSMKNLKITQLEFFIQTHYHSDHSWMTPDVIRNFNPKVFYAIDPDKIVLPEVEYRNTSDDYWDTPTFIKRITTALSDKNIKITQPQDGQTINLGSATLKFVNANGYLTDVGKIDHNATSLGVVLTHGSTKTVLFGDGIPTILDSLMPSIGQVDLSFMPHHGMNYNTSDLMITTLNPKIAVYTRFNWTTYKSNIADGRYQALTNAAIYHFDGQGNELVFTSDGTKITAASNAASYKITNNFYLWSMSSTNNSWRYFDTNGNLVYNQWIQWGPGTSKKWYVMDTNGYMVKGWFNGTNNWYYMSPTTQDSYYKDATFSEGEMQVNNWIFDNGYWYWLKSDGTMAKSQTIVIPATANGKSYIFDAAGHCTNPNGLSLFTVRAINIQYSGSYDKSGDCTLLEYNGKYALIDAGGLAKESAVDAGGTGSPTTMDPPNTITTRLKALGVQKLEWFLITHFHYDHAMFAANIIRDFNPGVVYGRYVNRDQIPLIDQQTDANNYWNTFAYMDLVKQAMDDTNKILVSPKEDDVISLGDVQLKFINANSVASATNDYNVASIAMLATHGNVKFFFASDSTPSTMNTLIDKVGKVDVVFAAHHGYNYNNSAKVARTLAPKHVVSTSTDSNFNNSNGMALYKVYGGAKMYKDNSDGQTDIIFVSDGANVTGQTATYNLSNMWVQASDVNDWFYINSNSEIVTNAWQQVDSKWYYFNTDGTMKRGWHKHTDGCYYYLSPKAMSNYFNDQDFKDGEMQVNNWILDADYWYWLDSEGKMVKDRTVTIHGINYDFDSGGRWIDYSKTSTSTSSNPSTNTTTNTVTSGIQLVGANTVSRIDYSPVSLTVPNGTQTGDVMVAFISLDNNSTKVNTSPTGWTKLTNGVNSSGHLAQEIWYKIATNASTDLPGAVLNFTLNLAEQHSATLAVFRNVNNTTPFGNNASIVASASAPSITISSNGNWLLTQHSIHSNTTLTSPTGMTTIKAVPTELGSSVVSYEVRSSGITGTRTVTNTALAASIELIYKEPNVAPSTPGSFIEPVSAKQKGTTIDVKWGMSTDTNVIDWKNINFDDSKWASVYTRTVPSSGWTDNNSSAIWGTTGTNNNVSNGENYFRKKFTLTANTSVTMDYTADDIVEVYIDGVLRASTTGWDATTHKLSTFTIAQGDHILAVRGINNNGGRTGDNPAFVAVSIKQSSNGAKIVGTDSSWKVLTYPSSSSLLQVDTVKYELDYKYDNAASWQSISNTLTTNSTTFTIPSDTTATAIQFRVAALDSNNLQSDWVYSNQISLLNPNRVPNAPTAFIAPTGNKLNKGAQYRISWNNAKDPDNNAVSYELQVKIDNLDYIKIASGFIDNFRDYIVPPGATQSITFRVRAIDIYGAMSSFTTSTAYLLNDAPTAPSSFTSPIGTYLNRNDTYKIQWTLSSDFDRLIYELEYSYDNINYSLLVSTSYNSYDWTTPTNIAKKNVWFRVRAKDANGAYSGYKVSNQYLLNSKPDKPIWLSPSPENTILRPGKSVTLSWGANDPDNDSLTYNVFVSYKGSVPPEKIGDNITAKSMNYTVNNSYVSGKVIFSVYAIDSKREMSEPAASSEILSQAAPGQPIINLSAISWTNSDVNVTIQNGSDTGGGIWGTQYRIDGGSWTTYTGPFTISKEGQSTIDARTLDSNLYASDIVTRVAKIDKIKPNKPTITLDKTNWTNSNVKIIIFDNGDNGSGILRNEYKINDGGWIVYNVDTALISTEGVSNVSARTVDMAGNVSDIVTATAKIDKTKPTKPTIVLDNNNWSKNDVSFTLMLGSDSLSGLDVHQYKLNDGDWTSYNGKVTVTNDGLTVVQARARDVAGNYSDESTVTIKIDKSAPLEPIIHLSNNNWSNIDVSFTIDNGQDNLSGAAYSEFKINSGSWQRYIERYNVSIEGTTTIYARTFDNVGNVSSNSTAIINIDKTNPVPPSISLSESNWTKNDVTVNISGGTDSASGIERTEYKISDGIWQTYISPLVLSDSGQIAVFARAIDKAGNYSNIVNAVARIDKIGPSMPIIELNHDDWTKEMVVVTIEKDPRGTSLSGIKIVGGIDDIEYKLNDNDWVPYYGPFSINTEGQTVIYARTIDNLNNYSLEATAIAKIDKNIPAPPTITVDDSEWNNKNKTFTITGDSGEAAIVTTVPSPTAINNSIVYTGNVFKKLDSTILINNWIVTIIAVRDIGLYDSCQQVKFSISKDNGLTWNQLCYANLPGSLGDFSLTSFGTKVYLIFNYDKNDEYTFKSIATMSFDAINVSNTGQNYTNLITNYFTSIHSLSSCIDQTGGSIHIAISGNPINSNNTLFYQKLNINSDNSLTLENNYPTEMSYQNSYNWVNPHVIMDSSNNPLTFVTCGQGSGQTNTTSIGFWCFKKDDTSGIRIKDSYDTTYITEYQISALLIPKSINGLTNGRVWATFQDAGMDDNHKRDIYVIYSDDNGTTWSTPTNLTRETDNILNSSPSITADKTGKISVIWQQTPFFGDVQQTGKEKQINICNNDNGIWGAKTPLVILTQKSVAPPKTIINLSLSYQTPLFVYNDIGTNTVLFNGNFILSKTNVATFTGIDGDSTVMGSQTVKLSNGWFVLVTRINKLEIRFYVSKDNGNSWNQLCYTNTTPSEGPPGQFSLASYGTKVYLVFNIDSAGYSSYNNISTVTFDAITVANERQNYRYLSSTYRYTYRLSWVADQMGNSLHLAIEARRFAGDSYYSIYYHPIAIGSDNKVSIQDATINRVTPSNCAFGCPNIIMNSNNMPIIFTTAYANNNGYSGFWCYKKDDYGFTGKMIKSSTNTDNSLSQISALIIPKSINNLANGRIWTAFPDKINNMQDIFTAYSDDNGITWSTSTNLTNETNTNVIHSSPSITGDKTGKISVIWQRKNSLMGISEAYIKTCTNINGTWGSIVNLQQELTTHSPKAVVDLSLTYNNPLFIADTNGGKCINFYGNFIVYDLSGLKEVQYRIGLNGSWNKYETPIVISNEGLTTVFARTLNNINVPSKLAYAVSKINKSTPTGDIIINDGMSYIDSSVSLVKLSLRGTDNGAGVVDYMVSNLSDLSDATWTPLNNKVRTTIRTIKETSALFNTTEVVTDSTTFNRYFSDEESTLQPVVILDNIDWLNNVVSDATGKYSVQHEAYFTPSVAGQYQFGINVGDATEFYVDTTLVAGWYNGTNSSSEYNQTGTINLDANKEYKLTFKTLRNNGNAGAKLSIKRPNDSDMFVVPPEMFFKSTVTQIIDNWNLGDILGTVAVYAKFKDAIGNISTRYSDGIMKNALPTGTIISPVSQSGWLINQRPKIVVKFSNDDGGSVIDFKIQISSTSDFANLILEDAATTVGSGWNGIAPTINDTKIYIPTIDIGLGIKYMRVAVKDDFGWGNWSDTVQIEIKEANWTDTIDPAYDGVRGIWIEELREKMCAIKAARGMGYHQEFKNSTFANNGVLLDTSTQPVKFTINNSNPYINMYNIGNFSPSKYRYFIIRYRITGGTPDNSMNIYYRTATTVDFTDTPPESQLIPVETISDGNWQIAYCDAWENENWKTDGAVTGWRLSLGDVANVVYEIDYVALSEDLTDIKSSDIVDNVTPVRVVHLTELRDGFRNIATSINDTITWTDEIIDVDKTDRKGIHWIELRNAAEKS